MLFCGINLQSYAQSDILTNSQWYNLSMINPASVNMNYRLNSGFVGRQQWVGFEGAPRTGAVFADYFDNKLNSKFGLAVTVEGIGYTQRIHASGSYAYNLQLNTFSYLRFGIGGGIIQQYFDKNRVDVDDADDPVIIALGERPSRIFPDLNFGIEYEVEGILIGVAANHITGYFFQIEQTSQSQNLGTFSNSNYLYAIYKFPVAKMDNKVNMQFGVRGIQTGNVLQGEVNATLFFVKQSLLLSTPGREDELFWVGVAYRTSTTMVFNAGVNLTPNISLAYSYDISFGRLNTLGSHEFGINYRLKFDNDRCGCLPVTTKRK